MDIDKMIEKLKETVIEEGIEAAAIVLGYYPDDSSNLEELLDDVLDQMPDEEIEHFYYIYCD